MEKFFKSFYKHYIFWIFAFTAVYTALYMILFRLEAGTLFYMDTDPYTRALRILDWLNNFQWSEKIFPYGNPPDGFVLHFTRICDVIWVFLSLPFMLFMPLKEAIFYGGIIFSPLFYALSLSSLFWALRLYLPALKNKETVFFIAVMMAMLFFNKLSNCFDFCRPDHHSLMGFVFCFNLAVILRNQLKSNPYENLLAGILAGCGVWASSAPEGFFVALLFLSVLSLNWIFGRENIKIPLYYSIGFFISVTLAWLINPPYGGWKVIDNNRLSLIHPALGAFMFLSFLITAKLQPQNKWQKLTVISACAALSFLLMLMVFGTAQIFSPTYSKEAKEYLIPYIAEMEPVFHDYVYLTWLIVGIILAVLWVFYTRLSQTYEKNILFLEIATGLSLLFINRFHIYFLGIFTALYILMLYICFSGTEKKLSYKYITLVYLLVPIFLLFSIRAVPQNTIFPEVQGIGLTKIFDAPRLVFEQNVDVIGFPYHTNPQGVADNYLLCHLTKDDDVHEIFHRYNVQFIYISEETASLGSDKENNPGICEGLDLSKEYPWLKKTATGAYLIMN